MSVIKKQKNKGFTILETLVAVFVLSVAITGPLVFAQSGLRASFLSRDQIIALFLTQDAIEAIKNIRDTNGLQGQGWLVGIEQCKIHGGNGMKCRIDTTDINLNLTPCSESGGVRECLPLKYDPDNGYGYSSGTDSNFTRTIYITEVVIGKEAEIVVEVEWESHERIGTRKVIAQENMFNWINLSGP